MAQVPCWFIQPGSGVNGFTLDPGIGEFCLPLSELPSTEADNWKRLLANNGNILVDEQHVLARYDIKIPVANKPGPCCSLFPRPKPWPRPISLPVSSTAWWRGLGSVKSLLAWSFLVLLVIQLISVENNFQVGLRIVLCWLTYDCHNYDNGTF